MKWLSYAVLAGALLGPLAVQPAQAHARVVIGIGVGPVWAPYYYPPPYYYQPPPTVVVASPPVYVEQPAAGSGSEPGNDGYWYYCNSPTGYYPYVKACPDSWQQVTPQPPQ